MPHTTDLAALGVYATAGARALALALERAARSLTERRIPIAAAAVARHERGALVTIAVGHNGRIPAPGSSGRGYPTDHGETAAVRAVEDFAAVDWRRVVFATTLSPCVMCTRTLEHLHGLGLDKVVVAEAASFRGGLDRLRALPGMTVVELAEPRARAMMAEFRRCYPWEWDADIGAIPARETAFADRVVADPALQRRLLADVAASCAPVCPGAAAVVTAAGELLPASDDASAGSGNPTHAAVMLAMGRAGSRVNLRECVLVCAWRDRAPVGLARFGLTALGACELFRPAVVLSGAPFTPDLRALLQQGGTRVCEPA